MSIQVQGRKPVYNSEQSTNTNIFDVDLSARLYLARNAYFHAIDDHFVAYTPDHQGYPFLVDKRVHKLLSHFEGGCTAGDAIQQSSNDFYALPHVIHCLSELEERGLLVSNREPSRHIARGFGSKPNDLSVWLHINNHCNLDCAYCFVNKFTSEMTQETMLDVIDRLHITCKQREINNIVIKFAGGEPAMSVKRMHEFCDLFNSAMKDTSTKIRYAIITNGTILSTRLLSLIIDQRLSVNISLDGYGEEGHDIYRVYKSSRKGSWRKIISNIDRLIELGIRPNINATISERSCATLPDLARWLASKGLSMRLSVVREVDFRGKSVDAIKEAYREKCATFINAFERTFQELENENVLLDVRDGFNICELNFDRPSHTACCGIGSGHIVIQDDGRQASCPMTTRENSSVASSHDVVRSARATVRHWDPASRNTEEKVNCLDCQWFSVCTSGCPVTNERTFGVPFTVSPIHEFYIYVIPRYVIFYGRKLLQAARQCGYREFDIFDSTGRVS